MECESKDTRQLAGELQEWGVIVVVSFAEAFQVGRPEAGRFWVAFVCLWVFLC